MIKFATERLILRNDTMEDVQTVGDAYKEDADGNPIRIRSGIYRLTV